MGVHRAIVGAALSALALAASVRGELNACLGVEMSRLHAIPMCATLYTACEVGVSMLNQQLHVTEDERFSPVSVVSASQSHVNGSENTLVAMLVQLAPIDECADAPAKATEAAAQRSCTFDMAKLQVYSILVTLDKTMRWSLDGYKHHALTESERARIVEQYRIGKFFGSNLAVGIFDAPSLPLETPSNAHDKTFARSTAGIFLVLASAGLSIGLLFHHRRRLHNGYAPIVILKRGQLQAGAGATAGGGSAATPKPKPKASASSGTKPELTSLRQSNPVPRNEDTTIKHEANERFAV